ncbi:unnamed protein product, partial [Chrysoparadoxa australica]
VKAPSAPKEGSFLFTSESVNEVRRATDLRWPCLSDLFSRFCCNAWHHYCLSTLRRALRCSFPSPYSPSLERNLYPGEKSSPQTCQKSDHNPLAPIARVSPLSKPLGHLTI